MNFKELYLGFALTFLITLTIGGAYYQAEIMVAEYEAKATASAIAAEAAEAAAARAKAG